MANWEAAQTLHASAARTATGASAAIDLGVTKRLLRQQLNVTAVAGASQTLDVRLESSVDGLDGWKSFATFTRAQAVAVQKIAAISPDRYVRVSWTIAGSGPSFTFDVDGNAGITYANLADLATHGLPGAALSSVSDTSKCEALAAASEEADGKLAVVKTLPLVSWGTDLTKAICKIAAYELLSVKGFNPDGDDANVRDRYLDAMKWLDGIAKGTVAPSVMVDSTPEESESLGAEVVTHAARAWR